MDTTPKNSALEVTGVSRSGRVCKKSSKLMDFQSPDEIETKIIMKPVKNHPPKYQLSPNEVNTNTVIREEHHYQAMDQHNQQLQSHHQPAPPYIKIEEPVEMNGSGSDMDIEDDGNVSNGNEDSGEIEESDGEEESNLLIEDEPMAKKSIYMTEKTSKKKMLKDGKIVFGKAQRKDKGKTRFTAYMLWAKDTRKHITIQNPDHDFASMSKRLGEMWANVPETQKYNWRRRAKRLATKMRKDSLKAKAQAGTLPSPYATKYNTSRSSTRCVEPLPAPIIHEPAERNSRTRGGGTGPGRESPAQPKPTQHSPTVKTEVSPKYSPTAISGAAYKMPTASAADVAAHLKLLGDSLTIIGERLKEHEAVAGNLSVSGSLSVLLDSLLCSLGPLICLTTHIPVVGEQLDLKDLFSNTLDNIAYVMPGL